MNGLIDKHGETSSMRFAFIFVVVLVSLVVIASVVGAFTRVLETEVIKELLMFATFALPFAFIGKATQSIFENKKEKDSE